jgi:hypothetical protein
MTDSIPDLEPPARSGFGSGAGSGTIYLEWTPSWVGAIVAAALSFVLLAFGAALGLAVASPSSSWRDTSAVLTLLSGLWLLLTALASFGLGGYLAGRLRIPLRPHTREEVEFRDGIHGLLVWAMAVLIGALLRSAVIVAFMVGASLMLGAAVAWLAAAAGGQHRDGGIALDFWRRWEVDRTFVIR